MEGAVEDGGKHGIKLGCNTQGFDFDSIKPSADLTETRLRFH